jgi:hypothetical protein
MNCGTAKARLAPGFCMPLFLLLGRDLVQLIARSIDGLVGEFRNLIPIHQGLGRGSRRNVVVHVSESNGRQNTDNKPKDAAHAELSQVEMR